MMDREPLKQWAAKMVMRDMTPERVDALAKQMLADTHIPHPALEAMLRNPRK